MLKLSYCQKCMEAISHPTRTKILESLAQKSPQTVGEIVSQFQLRQPTISHHLAVLKDLLFVTTQKRGNQIYYSINLACHKTPTLKCYLLETLTAAT